MSANAANATNGSFVWITRSAQNAPTTTHAVARGRRVFVPIASPARNTSPNTTTPSVNAVAHDHGRTRDAPKSRRVGVARGARGAGPEGVGGSPRASVHRRVGAGGRFTRPGGQ